MLTRMRKSLIVIQNITYMTKLGMSKQLWQHYWEESIQGYSYPPAPSGRPTLRFKIEPATLVQSLCIGASSVTPQTCAFNNSL